MPSKPSAWHRWLQQTCCGDVQSLTGPLYLVPESLGPLASTTPFYFTAHSASNRSIRSRTMSSPARQKEGDRRSMPKP